MSVNQLLDEKDTTRLELTLQTRENIVHKMLEDGIPEAEEDRAFLLKAMDGLDRVILTKARIKSDDTAVQNQRTVAKLIADILVRSEVKDGSTKRLESPVLESSIVADNVVEGETDIGVHNFSYDTFMEQ